MPGGPAIRLSTLRRSFSQKVQRSTSLLPRIRVIVRNSLLLASSPRARRGASLLLLAGVAALLGDRLDHLVHEAVLLRFIARHEVVAVAVGLDLLGGLPGVAGQDVDQRLLQRLDLPRLDVDVLGGAARAPPGLVDHHPRVGEAEALAL